MAVSVTELNAVSTKIFDKTMKPQIYDRHDFLKYLMDNGKVKKKGGTQLTWPIRYRRLDKAEAVNWEDQVDFQTKSTRTQAQLEWIPYRVPLTFTWKESVMNGAGQTRIVNLLEDKATEGIDDMVYRMATDLWATSSVSGHVIPMYVIVDADDTYAGIAVSDVPAWAGKEDSSSSKMTRALMYAQQHAAEFNGDEPSRHYTTRSLAADYDTLLSADERYVDKDSKNAGTAVTLHNKPVISDPYIGSGDWFGLDVDQFEMWVHEDNDMDVGPWEDLTVGGYPKTVGRVITNVCNLVCRMRRTSFKLTALTGT